MEQSELSAEDEFVLKRLRCGELKHRELEKKCDAINAVRLRRKYLEEELLISLDRLPFKNYDYKLVSSFIFSILAFLSVKLNYLEEIAKIWRINFRCAQTFFTMSQNFLHYTIVF